MIKDKKIDQGEDAHVNASSLIAQEEDSTAHAHAHLSADDALKLIEEDCPNYASAAMKKMLSPFVKYKWLGIVLLVLLIIIDKVTLPQSPEMSIERALGIMAMIGMIAGIVIVIVAEFINRVLRRKEDYYDD